VPPPTISEKATGLFYGHVNGAIDERGFVRENVPSAHVNETEAENLTITSEYMW
jgi:hypothetical protein